MEDKLVEINAEDLASLRDLYLIDWPNNLIGYYTIDNFINWLKFDSNIKNLKVYSLNGDWTDGTFLIIDRYQLFLNSLNKSNDRLKKALELLDWSHGYKVSTFLLRHRPAVLDVIESKNLIKEYDSLTPVYYLPMEDAKQLDLNVPDDIVLKNMCEEHAVTANELWPNKHEGSDFFLKRLSKWNPNIGAFTKSDKELVAWCFRLQAGPLGALQVKESHFRKGLGSLVTTAMCKILASIGHDTIACVGENNTASRNMFEHLGFKVIDTAFWLRTFPTVENYHWQD